MHDPTRRDFGEAKRVGSPTHEGLNLVNHSSETTPNAARYVSLDVAAGRLGCSERTLRRMVSAGEIPAYRLSKRLLRVDWNDIERMLRRIPTADNAA